MKKDFIFNDKIKPGYNIQIVTENIFVICYNVLSNPTDTRTFKPHLHNAMHKRDRKFKYAVENTGYGSKKNYDYLIQR